MAGRREQSDSDLFLDYALRVTKGRIRLAGAAGAAMVMLTVAAGFGLVVVVGDHYLPGGLSADVRLVLRWALLVGQCAIAAGLVIRPLIRRLNDLYVTRLIEKAHPEFRNDLTAALQLARDKRAHAGTVAAVRRRAAEEVSRADVQAAVSMRRVRISGAAAAVAVAVFALYWLVAPKAVWPSLRRAFGDDAVSPPTHTEIVSVSPPSGTVVLSGTPVDFSARIRRAEGPPLMRVSRDGGKTFLSDDVLAMHPIGQDGADRRYTARWPVAAANDGLAVFQVLCGDAAGTPHELKVLPRPAVREVRVRLDWPAYTRQPPTELSGGHVEALVESRATVFAEANLPVRRASLVFGGRGPVIMSSADAAGPPDAPNHVTGRRIEGAFVVRKSDRYRIVFHGTHELVRGESMEYTVAAFTDDPPEVRLTEPTGNVELAVNEALRLAGEARDRFGIGRVELVCENGDGRLRHVSLEPLLGRTARQVTIEGSLPVALLGRRGERLRCWVEATDFLPPDGQVGRSEAFVLTIKEPDAQIAARDASEEAEPGEDDGGQEPEPDGHKEGEADSETAPGAPAGDADEGMLELVRRDADRLETLREHLDPGPQPQGQNAPGEEGHGDEAGRDAQEEGDDGQGQGQGEGQGEGEGQGQGSGAGQGEGSGEGSGQGEGDGAGQGQGEGQGEGEGQGQGSGAGQGAGAGEGSGQGQGAGEGQGQGSPAGNGRGAEGMHSGAGGGDSKSGSSDRPARLDPTTRPDELTPRQRERLESIGRALDEASRRIRDDEVDPKLLEELGMTRRQFEAFVEEYTRRFGKLKPMPSRTPAPGGRLGGAFSLPGSDRLQQGNGRDAGIGDVEGGEKLSPDEVRRLRESRIRRVFPKYRRQVESYFKSISEQAPPTPATSPAE